MHAVTALIFLCVGLSSCADPTPPVLPAKWHGQVWVSDNVVWPLEDESLGVAAQGNFYYDSSLNTTAYWLEQRFSGRVFQEINVFESSSRYVYTVDGPTGTCTKAAVIEPGRYDYFSPTFLSDRKFKFVANEYFYVDTLRTLVLTQHWQNLDNPLVPVNYWHQVETNTPYRLQWGSLNPLLIEFSSVVAQFADIPNPSYYMKVPSQCNAIGERDVIVLEGQGHRPPETNFPPKIATTGSAWPLQWHGQAMYTGNDFGLQPPLQKMKKFGLRSTVGEVGSPTLLPITLSGHFYYDFIGQRECNEWVDEFSHIRTKTLIVDGKFHVVTLPTNSCMIVPTYPVGGPLKPAWPTNLPYVDEQFRLERGSFIRSQHFLLDALNIGVEHAFNYWQTEDNKTPMQFQGPVLEFYPYGQSAMLWSETVVGLSGVNTDDIFSVPPDCPFLDVQEVATKDRRSQIQEILRKIPPGARAHLSMALSMSNLNNALAQREQN